jgi:hypothetical protein
MKFYNLILLWLIIVFSSVSAMGQNIEYLGRCDGPFWNVCVEGDYLYSASLDHGLRIYDVSIPAQPIFIDSVRILFAQDVIVESGIAYISGEDNLTVVNVSNAESSFVVGSCPIDGYSRTLTKQGDFIYAPGASSGFNGLHVIDVTDPAHPNIVGSCPISGITVGIGVSQNYIFDADYSHYLKVIDVANPANPVLIDSCEIPDLSHAIAISGKYAYIADGNHGLQIIDISNPRNTFVAGHYSTHDHATDVAVWDNLVILSAIYLYVLDVSNPANPILITSSSYASIRLFVYDNIIYIFGNSALGILRFNPTGNEEDDPIPLTTELLPIYPNPFNSTTSIRYSMANAGQVNLYIFNLLGQNLVTLIDEYQEAGNYDLVWDANGFPSGCYFAKLVTENGGKIVKMDLIK